MACQQNQALSAHSNEQDITVVSSGRLVFVAEMAVLTLHGDPLLPTLYEAHFVTDGATVRVQENTVLIQCPSTDEAHVTITLRDTIPWEIECRSRVVNLQADLRGLRLRAFDLGGIRRGTLLLARPVGVAFLYMAGNVSDLVIQRAAGMVVRLQISGRANNLLLDAQPVPAALDGIDWQSHADSNTAARYDIRIAGDVDNLTIATW